MRTDQTPFDSLGENWAEPIQGRLYDGVQIGNLLNYQVTVTDEASKVNINTADAGLITNLLMQVGASAGRSVNTGTRQRYCRRTTLPDHSGI